MNKVKAKIDFKSGSEKVDQNAFYKSIDTEEECMLLTKSRIQTANS